MTGPQPVPSLDALIERHGRRLMGLLGRLIGDREDARDVYQETWCAIWQALPRLRPAVDPWPFIRQAAVRKAIDHLRVRKPVPVERVEPEAAPIGDRLELAPIEIELAGLPPAERICLRLFFFAGCSVREIADHLGVPTGTVKTWMHRGRQRLRTRMEERDDDPRRPR